MHGAVLFLGLILGAVRVNAEHRYDPASETIGDAAILWNSYNAHPSANLANNKDGVQLASFGNFFFVVFVDKDLRPKVARIGLLSQTVRPLVLNSDFTTVVQKRHAYQIAVDELGYVHVGGDMNNYPRNGGHLPPQYQNQHCMLWKGAHPLDVASFQYRGNNPHHCPLGRRFYEWSFVNDQHGTLFFRSRVKLGDLLGVSMSRFDTASDTWSLVGGEDGDGHKFLVTGTTPSESGRCRSAVFFDTANALHFVATLPDGSQGRNVTHVVYARSNDDGRSFFRTDGTKISLPMRLKSGGSDEPEIAFADQNLRNRRLGLGVTDDLEPFVLVSLKDAPDNYFSVILNSGGEWRSSVNPDFGHQGHRTFVQDRTGVTTMTWPTGKITRFFVPTSGDSVRSKTRFEGLMIDRAYQWRTGDIVALSETFDRNAAPLSLIRMRVGRPVPYPPKPPPPPTTTTPIPTTTPTTTLTTTTTTTLTTTTTTTLTTTTTTTLTTT
eukprot:Polyplicarium_translucidae@DN4576_c0_g1_i2.p1